MKNFIIGTTAVLVAFCIGVMVMKVNIPLGANAGPEHFNQQYFYGGMIQGGSVVSVSNTLATSTTLTAAQICTYDTLNYSPASNNASTTMPTAANLIADCFQTNGAWKTVVLKNNASSGAAWIIAGTGDSLFFPTGGNLSIAGGSTAFLDFYRASSTGMFINVREQEKQ